MKKGFSILDILIFVLIIAVLVALILPKLRKDTTAENQTLAREKMVIISDAMHQYFITAAGRIELPSEEELDTLAQETPDSLLEEVELTEEEAPEDTIRFSRLYTDDFKDLEGFLPDGFEPTSPPNGRYFKLFAKDSAYFAIYDPNGNGTIVNSKRLWADD